MTTLYVQEYEDVAVLLTTIGQAGQEPAIATQTVAIGASSAVSTSFNYKTKMVRVHTDAICSLKFGTAPVAVNTGLRMAANTTEFFGVVPGHKVAVITNT